jgi:hypothetical protein
MKYRYNDKRNKSLEKRWGFQKGEDLRFQDIWHMKVVRLSALLPGRLYPPRNITGTDFC